MTSILPDKRLIRVLEKLSDAMSSRLKVSLRGLSNNWAEEVQYSRFIKNKRVKMENLSHYLQQCFQKACPQSGHILLIEDSSQVSFGLGLQIEGLGSVGRGTRQGFYIHPLLALDATHGACYGIAGMEFVHREFEQKKRSRQEAKNQARGIAYEQKEGYRWYSVVENSLAYCPSGVSKTVIADREGDIYPCLVGFKRDLGLDYLIRSQHNRRLANGRKLWEEARSWPSVASFEKKLPATDQRLAHTARLEMSYGEVELQKPKLKSEMDLPRSWKTYLVRVWQAPETVSKVGEPIEWFLLTSHPVESPEQAHQVLDWYKERWNVEQLFRILKKRGLNIEDSRVESYERLQKIVILALIAAVKVLALLRARNGKTPQTMKGLFTSKEQKMLRLINQGVEGKTKKLKNPHPPDSLAFAAWVIARLGGWKGYQSKGLPGPIDFFNGLKNFQLEARAYQNVMKYLHDV